MTPLDQLALFFADLAQPTLSTRAGRLCALLATHPELVEVTTIEQKAAMVIVLQGGATLADREHWIEVLVTNLRGADLESLIRHLNRDPGRNDWQKLLFEDIDDRSRRHRLLEHVTAHTRWSEVGVISDFDDTVAPWKADTLGHDPEVFPGMAALLHELDRDLDGRGEQGDVHYVTARPALMGAPLFTYLAQHGFPRGSVDFGGLGSITAGGRIDGKVADIERLLDLYPLQRFVLLGDTSQQDPEVYREILARHPARILAAAVRRVGLAEADHNAPERLAGLIAFDTTVDLAHALHHAGVLSDDALDRVLDAARAEGLGAAEPPLSDA